MLNQDETWLLKEKYSGEKSLEFFVDCERLAAGEPLGYVIGFVPFLNCRIYLDSKPLIPRPETEFWVEQAIARIRALGQGRTSTVRVLDLCAGSGCIGVAVAAAIPEAHLTFAELDPTHLITIEKNLIQNTPIDWSIGDNAVIVVSDLFSDISGKFDFILSNPPYIDPVLDRAEPSVKNHEPHGALYGGRQGLELIEQIITQAPTHLTPAGQLWLEHEPEQTTRIHEIALQHGFSITTHKDQYQVERFSVLTVA